VAGDSPRRGSGESAKLPTEVKEVVTLLVNAILPSENPGPFSVKYYKKYGFV
jgi:hypothetical protein